MSINNVIGILSSPVSSIPSSPIPSSPVPSSPVFVMKCEICAENIKVSGKQAGVTCLSCQQCVCRTCCETYILDQTSAKCMYPNCKKDWSKSFLVDNFTNVFISNTYKKHLEDVYFEREKALLPMTQELVVNQIRYEQTSDARKWLKNEKKIILLTFNNSQDNIRRRSKNRWFINGRTNIPVTEQQWKLCTTNSSWYDLLYNTELSVINKEYRKQLKVLKGLYNFRYGELLGIDRITTAEKKQINLVRNFIRTCPSDDCKGFLSSAWKCGLCENHACSKCHVIIGKNRDIEHECDPDTLATATLIATESKPCPGCKINITKIDGCNQIWCTQCKTAWDWKSGCIETNVHNPHYFEYMRTIAQTEGEIERNPLEIRCGQEIDRNFLNSLATRMEGHGISTDTISEVFQICRNIRHTIEFDLRRYVNNPVVPDTVQLRIRYMRDQITEDKFKRLVQQVHKKHAKDKDIQDILHMYTQTATEIIYRYLDELDKCETPSECLILEEIHPLTEYANKCLATIGHLYKTTKYMVTVTGQKRIGLYVTPVEKRTNVK